MNMQETDVKVCSRCHGMFMSRAHTDVCNKCQAIENYQYLQIKAYLETEPDATMHDIYEHCHVDKFMIEHLLREERFELSEASGETIGCQKCGTAIRKGKYCTDCKAELTTTLQTAYQDIKENKHERKSVLINHNRTLNIHNLNRVRFEENRRHH